MVNFIIFIAIIAVSYIFIRLVWSVFPSNPKPETSKPVQRGYIKTLFVRCWKKSEGSLFYDGYADFEISNSEKGLYFDSEWFAVTNNTPVDSIIKIYFANKWSTLYLFKYGDTLKLDTLAGSKIEILKSEE